MTSRDADARKQKENAKRSKSRIDQPPSSCVPSMMDVVLSFYVHVLQTISLSALPIRPVDWSILETDSSRRSLSRVAPHDLPDAVAFTNVAALVVFDATRNDADTLSMPPAIMVLMALALRWVLPLSILTAALIPISARRVQQCLGHFLKLRSSGTLVTLNC